MILEQRRKNIRIRWELILCLALYTCLIVFLTMHSCHAASHFDFRHTHWGMTQREVMVAESLNLTHASDHCLEYVDKTGTTIIYNFIDGALINVHNNVHKVHYNSNHKCDWQKEFASHCDTYRRSLSNRYGPGAQHFVTLSQIHPDTLAHPWKNDQGTYSIGWKTPRTNINLHVTNIDFHHLRFTIVFEEIRDKRINYNRGRNNNRSIYYQRSERR